MTVPSLQLIAWPYHAGLRDVSMGLGATALCADERFRAALAAAGADVTAETILPVDASLPEVARIFELDRRLARRVAAARERGAFPLVLGGNCCSCLGTVAGAGPEGLGVVWFDAHADFDTTDDNLSGFTDVLGLAILTGTGWRALRETIPGFAPVPEERVVLGAVRDLEPYQRSRLAASAVRTVPGAMDADALAAELDGLAGAVSRVYLHVDLDALLAAIAGVFERFEVAAAALTAYDPRVDGEGAIADAARSIAARIARGASHQRLTRAGR